MRSTAPGSSTCCIDATRPAPTGETVGLSVQVGDARVFIDEVQSRAPLRFTSELGRLYPLSLGGRPQSLEQPRGLTP